MNKYANYIMSSLLKSSKMKNSSNIYYMAKKALERVYNKNILVIMTVVPKMERSLELMKLSPADIPPRAIKNFTQVMQKIVFLIHKKERE